MLRWSDMLLCDLDELTLLVKFSLNSVLFGMFWQAVAVERKTSSASNSSLPAVSRSSPPPEVLTAATLFIDAVNTERILTKYLCF